MEKSKCCGVEKRILPNGHGYQCSKCNKDEELLFMNEQTNNRIREEFEKEFIKGFDCSDFCGDIGGSVVYYKKDTDLNTEQVAEKVANWWLQKIDELLKSQKDRIFRRGYNQGVRCQIPYENLYAEALEDYQSKLKEE